MLAKKQLQPPFRQRDLLGLSDFIRHCKDRGVDTSEKQLEYYEKERLLLPAVRVNHGFVEHRNADGRTYYEYGCVASMGDDWLSKYEKRGLVEYPDETEFREWKTYKGSRPRSSGYSTEKLLPKYETFYSKYQIFPVKHIQDWLRLVVRDEHLFGSDEHWIEIGRKARQMFRCISELLQGTILRHYGTLRLLHDVLDLIESRVPKADSAYKQTFGDYTRSGCPEEAEMRASEAVWDSIDCQDRFEIPPRATEALQKSGLSRKEIEKRREEFAYLGFRVDPTRGASTCLDSAIRDILEKRSSDFKFARDCYAITEQFEWFLRMVGERPPTLEKLRSGIDRLKICVVCQRYFKPVRRTDITCRNKECIKAHRNELKAEWKRKRRKKKTVDF